MNNNCPFTLPTLNADEDFNHEDEINEIYKDLNLDDMEESQ